MTGNMPAVRPARPFFSSGPCAKRPGWTPEALNGALLGRSHRSKPGKAKLKDAIDRTKALLGIPADYRVGIVPASDTGAVEMAMWSLLGPRPVDCFAWESFGEDWVTDTVKQLKLKDSRVIKADYGELPDLNASRSEARHRLSVERHHQRRARAGRRLDFRRPRRHRRSATPRRAAFAMDLPWDKLDVVTFSWQKVLGGEAAHGMLVLSPRAVARLESYTPPWPMPKIFRMTKGGKIVDGIFEGETINTPSMLALEDYLDALTWAESIGGLKALIARSNANLGVLDRWVTQVRLGRFPGAGARLALQHLASVSRSSIPGSRASATTRKADAAKKIASLLEKEGVASTSPAIAPRRRVFASGAAPRSTRPISKR